MIHYRYRSGSPPWVSRCNEDRPQMMYVNDGILQREEHVPKSEDESDMI